FTNLAVAMGLLPTKGLALPFVSYGGSSLLVNAAAAGLVLNVSRFIVEPAEEAAKSVKRKRVKPMMRTAEGGAR
ncbi:MAG: FtsW/RodA/SpoVE family cell cycle protein, partial [Myxococcales bacterium]|nr:FtsW/RodA/SpoVE family cell cycle protein [Myxococcales bacterium]